MNRGLLNAHLIGIWATMHRSCTLHRAPIHREYIRHLQAIKDKFDCTNGLISNEKIKCSLPTSSY